MANNSFLPISDYRPYLITPSSLPDPWMQQSKNTARAAAVYFADSNEILPSAIPMNQDELVSGQYLGVQNLVFWLPNIKDDTNSFLRAPNAQTGQRRSIPFYIYMHDPSQKKVVTVSDADRGGALFIADQNPQLANTQLFTLSPLGYNLYALALQPFSIQTMNTAPNTAPVKIFTRQNSQPRVFLKFDFSSSYRTDYTFQAAATGGATPSMVLTQLKNICSTSVLSCPSCDAKLYRSGVGYCGVEDATFHHAAMNLASRYTAKKRAAAIPSSAAASSSSSSTSTASDDDASTLESSKKKKKRQTRELEMVALGVLAVGVVAGLVFALNKKKNKS